MAPRAQAQSKKPLKAKSPRSALASQIAERFRGGEVSLDQLISELGDVQRYDIVAALKELERSGAGTFTAGRSGQRARFAWNAAVKNAKPVAVEPEVVVSGPKAKGATRVVERAGGVLEHSFHLRPGYVVSVRIPADVSRGEMDRFCQFLQAIPFGSRS
ncbi:MAG: hypothetical protein RL701_2545 [Pseudomonadota bacterium]|jgi:hypothetical protein